MLEMEDRNDSARPSTGPLAAIQLLLGFHSLNLLFLVFPSEESVIN